VASLTPPWRWDYKDNEPTVKREKTVIQYHSTSIQPYLKRIPPNWIDLLNNHPLNTSYVSGTDKIQHSLLPANTALCSLLKAPAPNSCPRNNRTEKYDS